MTDRISILQKLAGLFTAALLAFLFVSPVISASDHIRANENLLSESKGTLGLLEERVLTDTSSLHEDEQIYARLQHSFVAEEVVDKIKSACNDASAHFPALAIEAACPAAQYQQGGLLHHTALLTISGPPETLLQALDSVSTKVQLDQFRITSNPETPKTATLSLRFSDVSKAPETEETQR